MSGTQHFPVTVIIPAYRVSAYISQTLDSVLAQTVPAAEIIVVNDGCPDTDNLEQALQPYRDRIVYIKQANGGVASARNTAIRAARCEWISTLDGDDYWRPDYLAVQTEQLAADPSIDVVYCDARIFGDTLLAGELFSRYSPSSGPVTFSSLVAQTCNVCQSVVGRKQAFEKVGGYDTNLRGIEDFDIWVRIAKSGGRITYHREPLVFYRGRNDSLSSNRSSCLQQLTALMARYIQVLRLTPEEQEVARQAASRFEAYLRLHEGKAALRRGEYDVASNDLRAANRFFSSFKIGATLQVMKVAPGLVRRFSRP
jgi:glycosyltransferase involved in cell wall biosynthesis